VGTNDPAHDNYSRLVRETGVNRSSFSQNLRTERGYVEEVENQSRTRTHAVAAAVAAGVLVLALIMAPAIHRYMHRRHMQAIQRAAEVDLHYLQSRETDFYKQHGSYTTDLKILGIAPKTALYKFGFVRAGSDKAGDQQVDAKRKDLDALKASDPNIAIEYSPATHLEDIDFQKLASFCTDCTATVVGFKAIAAAQFDDSSIDVWTIDQDGRLVHVVNALP
jgi:hypothetical protein